MWRRCTMERIPYIRTERAKCFFWLLGRKNTPPMDLIRFAICFPNTLPQKKQPQRYLLFSKSIVISSYQQTLYKSYPQYDGNKNSPDKCPGCQTVDKVPGLHRGFSIAVINISMILPVFIKKNSLLINSKVKRCVPCTWYNYPIRRFRL